MVNRYGCIAEDDRLTSSLSCISEESSSCFLTCGGWGGVAGIGFHFSLQTMAD